MLSSAGTKVIRNQIQINISIITFPTVNLFSNLRALSIVRFKFFIRSVTEIKRSRVHFDTRTLLDIIFGTAKGQGCMQ